MAKLYFRYGAMGSSKTANALMVAFNYEEKGLKPLVLKPKVDTRDGQMIIKSRIGIERDCYLVDDYIDEDNFTKTRERVSSYNVIIIDEVQFCTIGQIRTLPHIVATLNIPVICYGLKTDFQLKPFPASAELMVLADRLEEIKTVCWCGDGATCNARLDKEGNVIRDGEQVVLGGNESYTSLCYKHYMKGDIGEKARRKYFTKKARGEAYAEPDKMLKRIIKHVLTLEEDKDREFITAAGWNFYRNVAPDKLYSIFINKDKDYREMKNLYNELSALVIKYEYEHGLIREYTN